MKKLLSIFLSTTTILSGTILNPTHINATNSTTINQNKIVYLSSDNESKSKLIYLSHDKIADLVDHLKSKCIRLEKATSFFDSTAYSTLAAGGSVGLFGISFISSITLLGLISNFQKNSKKLGKNKTLGLASCVAFTAAGGLIGGIELISSITRIPTALKNKMNYPTGGHTIIECQTRYGLRPEIIALETTIQTNSIEGLILKDKNLPIHSISFLDLKESKKWCTNNSDNIGDLINALEAISPEKRHRANHNTMRTGHIRIPNQKIIDNKIIADNKFVPYTDYDPLYTDCGEGIIIAVTTCPMSSAIGGQASTIRIYKQGKCIPYDADKRSDNHTKDNALILEGICINDHKDEITDIKEVACNRISNFNLTGRKIEHTETFHKVDSKLIDKILS